jgi:hypothetical protein
LFSRSRISNANYLTLEPYVVSPIINPNPRPMLFADRTIEPTAQGRDDSLLANQQQVEPNLPKFEFPEDPPVVSQKIYNLRRLRKKNYQEKSENLTRKRKLAQQEDYLRNTPARQDTPRTLNMSEQERRYARQNIHRTDRANLRTNRTGRNHADLPNPLTDHTRSAVNLPLPQQPDSKEFIERAIRRETIADQHMDRLRQINIPEHNAREKAGTQGKWLIYQRGRILQELQMHEPRIPYNPEPMLYQFASCKSSHGLLPATRKPLTRTHSLPRQSLPLERKPSTSSTLDQPTTSRVIPQEVIEITSSPDERPPVYRISSSPEDAGYRADQNTHRVDHSYLPNYVQTQLNRSRINTRSAT